MRVRLLAGAGAVVIAAAATFAASGGAGSGAQEDGLVRVKVAGEAAAKPLVAPPSPRDAEPVEAIAADPENAESGDADSSEGLVLTPPEDITGWDDVAFAATWQLPQGETVHGVVDLQQIDGDEWATVTEVEIGADGGNAEIDVNSSGVYRLAYGGSDEVDEAVSDDVVVIVDGELLPSRITATASPSGDGMAEVIATWTTEGGVAVIGELELQQRIDGEWESLTTVTTDADSTATAEVEAGIGDRFRFVYEGGSRFDAAVSDEAVVIGDDARTIPVRTCTTGHEIDSLPYGVACHYTPVSSGTFVVAHDYLGNAWWNAMPMGTVVELEGEQAGLYEVVDRVIAPGRGSALGPASNWTCGDECDVILQTCQGANTGFTWLRQIAD